MNKLLMFFELHGLKLATVLLLIIFAQAGVFGPVIGSVAGVFAFLVLVGIAGILGYQYIKAEPIIKDGVQRVLEQQQKR